MALRVRVVLAEQFLGREQHSPREVEFELLGSRAAPVSPSNMMRSVLFSAIFVLVAPSAWVIVTILNGCGDWNPAGAAFPRTRSLSEASAVLATSSSGTGGPSRPTIENSPVRRNRDAPGTRSSSPIGACQWKEIMVAIPKG
jgi:hypothetical protein